MCFGINLDITLLLIECLPYFMKKNIASTGVNYNFIFWFIKLRVVTLEINGGLTLIFNCMSKYKVFVAKEYLASY